MSGDAPLLRVGIGVTPGLGAVPEDLLRNLLDFGYGAKRKKPASLDLLVAGDAEMIRLNRRHLGKDGVTDVLAFDDGETEEGRIRLGDVAVNFELAGREAARLGIERRDELCFYALHGLLHLLGMRDDGDADRARMHRAQAKIMRDFGLDVGEAELRLWTGGGEDDE